MQQVCQGVTLSAANLFIRQEQGPYRPTKNPVAFARKDFKPFRIEKGDPAASIIDQSLRLQLSSRRADADARNIQYLRHRLVRDFESAVVCPLPLYRCLQNPRAKPKRFTCDLRLSAERGLVFSHDPGKSDHTVVTGHRDFNRSAIFYGAKQRNNSAGDKLDVINRGADIKEERRVSSKSATTFR